MKRVRALESVQDVVLQNQSFGGQEEVQTSQQLQPLSHISGVPNGMNDVDGW